MDNELTKEKSSWGENFWDHLYPQIIFWFGKKLLESVIEIYSRKGKQRRVGSSDWIIVDMKKFFINLMQSSF